MVERKPSKLHTRVRFPSPAPVPPGRLPSLLQNDHDRRDAQKDQHWPQPSQLSFESFMPASTSDQSVPSQSITESGCPDPEDKKDNRSADLKHLVKRLHIPCCAQTISPPIDLVDHPQVEVIGLQAPERFLEVRQRKIFPASVRTILGHEKHLRCWFAPPRAFAEPRWPQPRGRGLSEIHDDREGRTLPVSQGDPAPIPILMQIKVGNRLPSTSARVRAVVRASDKSL